jgi:class 3 adenylate cyclase
MALIHRHYPIPKLDFRDFWDICSHYLRIHPKYRTILYSIDGFSGPICENESDVSKVLRLIALHQGEVRRYVARYYLSPASEPGDYGNAKMEYLPEAHDFQSVGLHFYADTDNKLLIYQFEDFIYNGYTFEEEDTTEIEYGLPCEVLAAVIDIRSFSAFCEQPDIESPYTCGLMTAFYNMVRNGFKRYPPDLVKFLGDGVLAVWQTTSKDRKVAIETCLDGLKQMPVTWRHLVRGPEFTHGAPEGIGSGVSFGLASKISIDNDYIGRPINLASRLCSVCPPAKTYIARNVPEVEQYGVKPLAIRLKSYGEQKVWLMDVI